LNDSLSFKQHWIWKTMTVKWSAARTGDVCLDVCCGSGDLARLLARRVGNTGQVIGVDFAKDQLAIAQQRTHPHLPIHWQEGDALNLPFSDNYFAAATMGYGLRNVLHIPRCLQELQRVLKPGARAAILDFNHPESLLMARLQHWYLETIVVPFATWYGFTNEYAYLVPSLEQFPTGREQVTLARQVGFSTVTHYPIAGGTMGVLVVQK